MQEILFKRDKNPPLYCKGDSGLEQLSIVGAIQNLIGHNPSSLLCVTLFRTQALVHNISSAASQPYPSVTKCFCKR